MQKNCTFNLSFIENLNRIQDFDFIQFIQNNIIHFID